MAHLSFGTSRIEERSLVRDTDTGYMIKKIKDRKEGDMNIYI